MAMRNIRTGLLVKALGVALCYSRCAVALDAPPAAAAAGYMVNTFSANVSASSVDTGNTGNSGFQWYPFNFFGSHASPVGIVINNDGSLTLQGDTSSPNAQLASATPAKNAAGFVGTAFGGGAYIEATLKFNPDDVAAKRGNGWPAWWSMGVEHLINREQWAGMPKGYSHFIEVDFMEYDMLSTGRNYYGICMTGSGSGR